MNAARIEGTAEGTAFAQRYELQACVGRGGMGAVYRARDKETGALCALKLLDTRFADNVDLTRFKREFRAAARLAHPNCLPVGSFGHAQGRWFFTMDYMPGGDLSHWKWRTHSEVVDVALQALAALDHIHAKSIVHRDVKPQNILLDSPDDSRPYPRIKLSDFGIAKVADVDSDATLGSTLGSLAYMSPEQAAGEGVDPRSDLYALGAVLYELLAGERPFDAGEQADSVARWLQYRRVARPVPLSEAAPQVPATLCRIVMKLLEHDPSDRYVTAAQAYDALWAWRQEQADIPQLKSPGDGSQHYGHPPLERQAYLAQPGLIGRDDALDQCRRWLAASFLPPSNDDGTETSKEAKATANAATPRPTPLLAVTGPAGEGKSRIAAYTIRQAALLEGAWVEISTCRAEPSPAYAPLAGLFDALAAPRRLEPTTTVRSAASGHAADASQANLLRFLQASATVNGKDGYESPHLRAKDTKDAKAITERREGNRWAIYRQITEQLLALGRSRPSLIVLEDAQWADTPTLNLIGFLARSVARDQEQARSQGRPPARVAFVLTHRGGGNHPALQQLHALGAEHQFIQTLPLQPLKRKGAEQLVAAMLMTKPGRLVKNLTGRLLTASQGNPLYLSQALHALVGRGQLHHRDGTWHLSDRALETARLPATIRDAIGDRASRFSVQTKELLAVAAVLGRRFDLDSLQALTGWEPYALLDAVDEAIRAQFVDELPQPVGAFRFTHDRIRDALYTQMPDQERIDLHRQVATHLETQHGNNPSMASDLAYHYRVCGQFDKSCHHTIVAAQYAMDTYAFERAVELYAHAVQLADAAKTTLPPAFMEDYGDACSQAGRYQQAAQCYDERLRMVSNPDERVTVLTKAAELEYRAGRFDKAARPLEQALEALGFSVPESNFALRARIAWQAFKFGVYTLVPAFVRVRPPKRRHQRLENICRATGWLIETYYFSDFLRTLFYCLVTVNTAARLGPSKPAANAFTVIGYLLAGLGQYRLSRRYFNVAQRYAEQAGGRIERGWLAVVRCMALSCEGKAEASAAQAWRADQILSHARAPARLRSVWELQAEAFMVLGRVEEAKALAHKLWDLCNEMNDTPGKGWAKYLLGHVASRRGDHSEAVHQLTEAMTLARKAGDITYRLVASARLSLEQTLAGQPELALSRAADDAAEYASRRLRNPTTMTDGALLAAAAVHHMRHGPLDPQLRKQVGHVRRTRRSFANNLRYTVPLFIAGAAAWDIACGKLERGRRGLREAVAYAQRHTLLGEQYDVHRLALTVLPEGDTDRAAHREELNHLTKIFQQSQAQADAPAT